MADKLSRLIQHQKVFIDAHGKEEYPDLRSRIYDDPTYDLHLHKQTNRVSINGKKEFDVDIRIPLNNPNRKMTIEYGGKKHDEIPGRLRKEIEEALENEATRGLLASEIAYVLSTYPSSVENQDENWKTVRALQRVAKDFGIDSVPIIQSWQTRINQGQQGLQMLSMVTKDNNRYNVMATDNYLLAEQAEPTHKHVIALYSGKDRGKSESIRIAFQILLERHPEYAIIFDNGEKSGDVKALLFINGAKVGIESQGDPKSRQMQSIEDFISLGCDVILTASRSSGMTTTSIDLHKHQYDIHWRRKRGVAEETRHKKSNRQVAEELVNLVESFADSAFDFEEE